MPVPVVTPPMTVDGDVVAVHSRWTRDGSRIVTEATIHTAQGDDVVVSQLGGTVDDITMITIPGPRLLTVGMTVAVAAHRGMDLANREHIAIDSMRVLAEPASFVRTGLTKSGKPVYWESSCAFVTVDAAGTSALPGDSELALIDQSIATWNDSTRSCSYMQLVDNGRQALEVDSKDHVNLIKFRDAVWSRPALDDDMAHPHDSSAAAITTVSFIDKIGHPQDGAIMDADVEINGVNFAISDGGASLKATGIKAELKNTLTHELGHLLGLEHPCLAAASEGPRHDNNGALVPTCSEVMSAPLLPANKRILDATMFNYQDPGETKKEDLSPDDINAICVIYPAASDPGTCEQAKVRPPASPSDSGGCSASRGADRPLTGLLIAGAAAAVTSFRRRRRRC